MPELPEVETMVRGIRPFVEGRRIVSIEQAPCHCKPITIAPDFPVLAHRVQGKTITGVGRLGKRCILELAGGDRLVIEPRMAGLILLSDPPTREHLRIEWKLSGRREFNSLWFWDRRGLGTMRLYTAAEFEQRLGGKFLGPDALAMTAEEWQARCKATDRPIKVALLDQKLVAGIGNLYASEILHRAGIHPSHPASRLSREQLSRMIAEVQAVLEEAIRYEGSTLGDGTYRNALNQSGSYQNVHRVYGRAGEVCRTCSTQTIQRIVQAQRSTFFCPGCQPLSRRGSSRKRATPAQPHK